MMKSAHAIFLGAAFLIAGFAACLGGAAEPNEPLFLVGVCTHFSQGKGDVEANLAAILNAGILSIRDEATWGSLERRPGELRMPEHYDAYVDASRASGVEPLLIFDYANRFHDDGDRPRSAEAIEGFVRYAEYMVKRFDDKVRLYEVWNEWDIGIGLPERHRRGGSPEDYVRLLRALYPRVKAVDPGITVMAGACTSGGVNRGWLEEIVRLGALEFCDAVSIHAYNYSAPFPERSPESCSAWIEEVRAMLRNHNDGKDAILYVTEMGWPTHVGKDGTDPELAASYLARFCLLARTAPSLRGLWWYDFQDDGWDAAEKEHQFGLTRPDLTPKPAYHVLAGLSDLLSHGTFIDRLPAPAPELWILRFRNREKDIWAVWCADDQDRQTILRNGGASDDQISFCRTGYPPFTRSWGQRLWTSNRDAERRPDILSFLAGARPILLMGDLSRVEVESVISRSRNGP